MKINFSHNYPKLWEQTYGKLIYVARIDVGTLHNDLIEYDTKYKIPQQMTFGYYTLPKTDLIQLVFLGNKDIPFCTLRRFTEQKFKYYSNKINEIFDIVVEG